MRSSLISRFRLHSDFLASFALCLSWAAGECSGFFLYRSSEQLFLSLMCGSFQSSVSIVMLLTWLLFPYLITAYVVYYKKSYILYPLCFLKAFFYCVAVFSVYGSFGGGWLMHLLFLFSENASICLLLAFWLRIISGGMVTRTSLWYYGGFILIAWWMDMVFITPFVVSILS